MVNIGLESKLEKERSIQVEEAGKAQLDKHEINIDIEHEIECPRCYDVMTLLSDYDSLYYSCEDCGFILYTVKKNI